MIRSTTRAALIALPCLLTACVVIGPTVPVTPAAGRSQAAFAEDRRACMAATDQQVQPVANRSATASMAGRPAALSTADRQNIYDATYGQCMAARGNGVAQPVTAALTSPAQASCGLRGIDIPVGTPIQQTNIRPGDQQTISFTQARTVVTRATVLSPPCHGTLAATRPIGFRYVSRKDYVGTDMFAIRACTAAGECSVTGMILTITE